MATNSESTLSAGAEGATGQGRSEGSSGDRATGLRRVARTSYVRGDELARGGMGRIVVATDVRHGRQVAIKELLHRDPEVVARFERESLIAARLQHPAIVPIYEAGTWDDDEEPFFAMKLVPGRTLAVAIAERPAAADRLALLPRVVHAVEAIAFAHERGVIHRDLKPHNILLGDHGDTVVIDWGLAKEGGATAEPASRPVAARGSDTLTQTGTLMGTPAYMAPEQSRAEAVDARADVYALGAVLHHLLTGAKPLPAALLPSLEPGAASGPRSMDTSIPAELRAIVSRAMAPEVANRYADAGELAADLRRYTSGQRVRALRYSWRALARRAVRRHRGPLAAGIVLALAAGAGWFVHVRATADRDEAASRERRTAEAQRLHDAEHTARAAAAAGDVDAAHAAYLALEELDPSIARVDEHVRFLIARHRPDHATEVANRFHQARPDDAAGARLLAEARLAAGDPRGAATLADEVLARHPGDLDARELRGRARVESGEVDAGLADLRAVVERAPATARYRTSLGAGLAHGRRHEDAIRELRAAIELEPTDPRTMRLLGVSSGALFDTREAEGWLLRATTANPLDAEGWFHLAIVRNGAGDNLEAEENARRATELVPTRTAYWYALGEMLRFNQKLDEALAAYHRALAGDPPHAKARTKIAMTLSIAGRHAEAERFLTEQLARDPDDPRLHLDLGVVYQALDKGELAQRSLERYLELAPVDDPPRAEVAAELASKKRPRR